jgi:phosphoribosyl 1,2-cyclic phosphodiesterase
MDVTFWGVRGSYPASGAAFAEFGHHTPCISVGAGDHRIVIDAGSGAAALGAALAAAPARRLDLLLSHFHLDHMIGLPFLIAGTRKAAELHVHAALGADLDLEGVVRRFCAPPYFPDEARELFRGVRFHAVDPGAAIAANGHRVLTAPLTHPGGSTGFRIEHDGRSLVVITDHEAGAAPDPRLIALARDADLLVHDTMFTEEEAALRVGWGHSTLEAALALTAVAGVRRLAGFHHSPAHDDATLRAREERGRARFAPMAFAREGETIRL